MLLNDNGCFFISTTNNNGGPLIEWRTTPMIYDYRDWDDGLDYYFMEFKEGESFKTFPLPDYLQDGLLDKIRDPDSKTHLMVSNSHEAFVSIISPIYEYICKAHNIPPSKVIVMNGAFDLITEVEKQAAYRGTEHLKIELAMDFEQSAWMYYHSLIEGDEGSFNFPDTLNIDKIDRTYLNLNRRWRPHRPTFVALLNTFGILEDGYVSLGLADDHKQWSDNMIEEFKHINGDNIYSLLKDQEEALLALPPLYLDTEDLVTNRAKIEDTLTPYYEKSLISIISETNYYTRHSGMESSCFLSEKAWKPILFKHPFMIISTPGILSSIRQLGYKTFGEIIDESYDTIEDDDDRMLAIIEETVRLTKMTKKQRKAFIKTAKEICDHNFDVLMNKTAQEFTHKINY